MKQFTTHETGFSTVDYVIFFVLCTLSCLGGIWYSAVGTKRKAVMDITDYLLGGQTMKVFPVAMSLIASYVSGVTILGTPSEIYNYGTQYWLVLVGVIGSSVAVSVIYLPVYFKLGINSSYQYLELRFNRKVRACAAILFMLDEIFFLPIVVFVPAVAFNQLTGVSVYIVGGIMVLICGLYTILGGLKAVVWTDSAQTTIMFLGVVVVAITATFAFGGPAMIMEIADKSGRLRMDNWSFSPYERQTGWGAVIGGFIYWTCFNSCNQTMVQRYLSMSSKKKAIGALSIFCTGVLVSITLCVWCGLTAWAAWVESDCNSSGNPLVTDRMLPAFVIYVSTVTSLKGIPGYFMAGLFGAGLSSLSAVLNACALVAVEDIMRGWLQLEYHPLVEGILARVATGILAVISVVMLFVVERLGGILGVATALSAIAASSTCGMFTLGMTCWWVGPRGAVLGAVAGAIVAGTVSFGSHAAAMAGLRPTALDYSKACPVMNITSSSGVNPESVFPLFRLSYHWIAPMGYITTLVVGMISGFLIDKKTSLKLDADLFTPYVKSCLPHAAIDNAGYSRLLVMQKNELRASRIRIASETNQVPPPSKQFRMVIQPAMESRLKKFVVLLFLNIISYIGCCV